MRIPRNPVSSGFTLVETLVAGGVTAALATMIFLQNKDGHQRSLQTKCIKNVRTLQFALTQYLDDNNGIFPVDQGAQIDGQWLTLVGWVVGSAKISGTLDSLTQGALYSYVGRAEFYHCPSDKSLLIDVPRPRLRSYSINFGLCSGAHTSSLVRISDISQPQRMFSFIDEDPVSINDGAFVVHPLETFAWWDVPADRHRQGGTLAFIDGHAEYWKWRAPKTGTPPSSHPRSAEDEADLHRLRAAVFWKRTHEQHAGEKPR